MNGNRIIVLGAGTASGLARRRIAKLQEAIALAGLMQSVEFEDAPTALANQPQMVMMIDYLNHASHDIVRQKPEFSQKQHYLSLRSKYSTKKRRR